MMSVRVFQVLRWALLGAFVIAMMNALVCMSLLLVERPATKEVSVNECTGPLCIQKDVMVFEAQTKVVWDRAPSPLLAFALDANVPLFLVFLILGVVTLGYKIIVIDPHGGKKEEDSSGCTD